MADYLVQDLQGKPWAVTDTEPLANVVGARFIGEGLFTVVPVRRVYPTLGNANLFRVQIGVEATVRRVNQATDLLLGAALEGTVTLANDIYTTIVLADSVEEASRRGLLRIETFKREQAGG